MSEVTNNIDSLLEAYPNTRYMGSKRKVLQFLNDVISDLEFETCLDAFSGSGVVSYYFKRIGKRVYSNDFMRFPYMYTLATIENESTLLLDSEVDMLLNSTKTHNQFIKETFEGLYFSDDDNVFLDKIRNNINHLSSKYTQAIALSALVRSCLKKRPRGIFTYVGDRYNDGRLDLQKSMEEHFLENIDLFNNAVFSNGQQNKAYNRDVFELNLSPDLVYLDPPYFSKSSDNDYSRRYHFVEGLVRNWEGLEIQNETKTKKFKRLNSSFDTKIGTYAAFESIFKRYKDSIIVVSYSSNSLPSKDEMIAMIKKHKKEVRIYEMEYLYSFGNQSSKVGDNANRVQEFIFVGI